MPLLLAETEDLREVAEAQGSADVAAVILYLVLFIVN